MLIDKTKINTKKKHFTSYCCICMCGKNETCYESTHVETACPDTKSWNTIFTLSHIDVFHDVINRASRDEKPNK